MRFIDDTEILYGKYHNLKIRLEKNELIFYEEELVDYHRRDYADVEKRRVKFEDEDSAKRIYRILSQFYAYGFSDGELKAAEDLKTFRSNFKKILGLD